MLPLEETLVSLRRPSWELKTCSVYPVMMPFWSCVGGGAQESVTLVLVEVTRLRLTGGLVGTGYIHVTSPALLHKVPLTRLWHPHQVWRTVGTRKTNSVC